MTDSTTPVRAARVVYVIGAGRSGTTLLDIALGNHPEIFGAGELSLFSVGDFFDRFYCPCGIPIHECGFWSKVKREWFCRTGLTELSQHDRLRAQFEGPRLQGLPRILRERLGHSRAFQQYAEQTTELYRVIAEVSGKRTIVDSSTIPMRAFALSLMPQIDLRLIHIVRDGRGVAYSQKKLLRSNPKAGICTEQQPRAVWRSTITWTGYNLLAEWVCRQIPADRFHFCRYEDLASDPQRVIRTIGTFLGCDCENIVRRLAAGEPLKVGCTFGGNRVRMQGSVYFSLDTDWQTRLSSRERNLFWLACGWLLRKYDYERHPCRNADSKQTEQIGLSKAA